MSSRDAFDLSPAHRHAAREQEAELMKFAKLVRAFRKGGISGYELHLARADMDQQMERLREDCRLFDTNDLLDNSF